MENKLSFFFRGQIWHIGGLIILFYLGYQLVDFKIFLVENSVPDLVPPIMPPRPKTHDLSVIAHMLF